MNRVDRWHNSYVIGFGLDSYTDTNWVYHPTTILKEGIEIVVTNHLNL